MGVGVVDCGYAPIYRLEVKIVEILRCCGKDATLGAIQWRRSCAKRVKVEVGCGVEGPGSRGGPLEGCQGKARRMRVGVN